VYNSLNATGKNYFLAIIGCSIMIFVLGVMIGISSQMMEKPSINVAMVGFALMCVSLSGIIGAYKGIGDNVKFKASYCETDSDCGTSNVCIANSCSAQTYVPAGCNTTHNCPLQSYCSVAADCDSGYCSNKKCLVLPCIAAKNCGTDTTCTDGTICASGTCTAGKCSAAGGTSTSASATATATAGTTAGASASSTAGTGAASWPPDATMTGYVSSTVPPNTTRFLEYSAKVKLDAILTDTTKWGTLVELGTLVGDATCFATGRQIAVSQDGNFWATSYLPGMKYPKTTRPSTMFYQGTAAEGYGVPGETCALNGLTIN
jgi:hypothetical protein